MTSLEVAVVFTVFIPVMIGVIDMSRYFFSRHALTALAGAAARKGVANPAYAPCGAPSAAWADVAAAAPLLDPAKVSLCVSQPFFAVGVRELTVTATYDFQTMAPDLAGLGGVMTERVTYRY